MHVKRIQQTFIFETPTKQVLSIQMTPTQLKPNVEIRFKSKDRIVRL